VRQEREKEGKTPAFRRVQKWGRCNKNLCSWEPVIPEGVRKFAFLNDSFEKRKKKCLAKY